MKTFFGLTLIFLVSSCVSFKNPEFKSMDGYTFDGIGFAAPQPYPSWTKNLDTYLWEAPTPMPVDDKFYRWDEDTTSWVEVGA